MNWLGLDIPWAYGRLLPSLQRRCRCEQRAQDALHEAFVRYAGAAAPGHAAISEPHAYLRRVAQHLLVDQQRREARHASLPETEGAEVDWPEALTCRLDPERVAVDGEHLRAVLAVIEALPPRAREVFWLYRIEGRRQREIAEALGISVNMVERHVIRAMVALRSLRQKAPA